MRIKYENFIARKAESPVPNSDKLVSLNLKKEISLSIESSAPFNKINPDIFLPEINLSEFISKMHQKDL